MSQTQFTPALPIATTPPTAAAGAKPTDDKLEATRKSAQDFEALFLSQMMKHMFAGIDTKGMFGGGPGEEAFRDMLTQEYAKVMAKSGGIGVASTVMSEMLRQQEGK
jgi:peptidoglycan hydrolase FlgJ